MVFMRSILRFALLVATMAAGVCAYGEPLPATLIKVRGTVSRDEGMGTLVPLRTGAEVSAGKTVVVGRMSAAVYKVSPQCLLKQDPLTTLSFTRLDRISTPKGHDHSIEIALQRGELYSALNCPGQETVDFHVTTSRIEAISHDAVFKVSHADSTSTVMVRDGEVEVLYCRNTKRAVVRAGEVFVVSDCRGVSRWFTEEESRQLSLFSGITDGAFAAPMVGQSLQVAVLAPEIPPDLPMVSP